MLFTSYTFIAFLAFMLAAYFLVPKKVQWITLLVGSYVFYAFAGAWYFVFILFTTASAYIISRLLERSRKKEDEYVDASRETLGKEERKAYRARAKKKGSSFPGKG